MKRYQAHRDPHGWTSGMQVSEHGDYLSAEDVEAMTSVAIKMLGGMKENLAWSHHFQDGIDDIVKVLRGDK